MNPEGKAVRETPDGNFPLTRWTVVRTAGRKSHPDIEVARAEVCTLYRYPVYAFVRRKGHSPEDAEDLTQGFFAVLLEKNYLGAADHERGRFRTFLLATCENYLRNEHARKQTLKRGGDIKFTSLPLEDAENRYQREPVNEMSPAKLYERSWALSLLALTLDRLRSEFRKAGKLAHFETFECFLSGDKHEQSYAAAAQKLVISEGAVRVAVHRFRSRYGELLRQTIAQTVSDPREIEEELRYLFVVLSR